LTGQGIWLSWLERQASRLDAGFPSPKITGKNPRFILTINRRCGYIYFLPLWAAAGPESFAGIFDKVLNKLFNKGKGAGGGLVPGFCSLRGLRGSGFWASRER
jgi:hypothetical protein